MVVVVGRRRRRRRRKIPWLRLSVGVLRMCGIRTLRMDMLPLPLLLLVRVLGWVAWEHGRGGCWDRTTGAVAVMRLA